MIPSIPTIRKRLIKHDLSHCIVQKNKGDIPIGWILPNGYIISARIYDHKEILDAIGFDCRQSLEESMVRKALEGSYECANSPKAIEAIRQDLLANLDYYRPYDEIHIEIVETIDNTYFFHSDNKGYKFDVQTFKRNDCNLDKLLTEKYRSY